MTITMMTTSMCLERIGISWNAVYILYSIIIVVVSSVNGLESTTTTVSSSSSSSSFRSSLWVCKSLLIEADTDSDWRISSNEFRSLLQVRSNMSTGNSSNKTNTNDKRSSLSTISLQIFAKIACVDCSLQRHDDDKSNCSLSCLTSTLHDIASDHDYDVTDEMYVSLDTLIHRMSPLTSSLCSIIDTVLRYNNDTGNDEQQSINDDNTIRNLQLLSTSSSTSTNPSIAPSSLALSDSDTTSSTIFPAPVGIPSYIGFLPTISPTLTSMPTWTGVIEGPVYKCESGDGMIAADTDDDKKLDENEFLIFVSSVEGHQCSIPDNLTGDLEVIFHVLKGRESKVDISCAYSKNPNFIEWGQMVLVCSLVTTAIDAGACPPTPSKPTEKAPNAPLQVPTVPLPVPNFVPTSTPVPIIQPQLQPQPSSLEQSDAPVVIQLPTNREGTIPPGPPISDVCIQNINNFDIDENDRLDGTEYLELIKKSSGCMSLLVLPNQHALNLVSWCKNDTTPECDTRCRQNDTSFCNFNVKPASSGTPIFGWNAADKDRIRNVCDSLVISGQCPGNNTETSTPSQPTVQRSSVPIAQPTSITPSTNSITDPPIDTSAPMSSNKTTMMTAGPSPPATIPSGNAESKPAPVTTVAIIQPVPQPTPSPQPLTLDACTRAIAVADIDNNEFLDVNEFLTLIVNYFGCSDTSTLSTAQQDAFTRLSCLCKDVPGASQYCCLPRNARIAITGVRSDSPSLEEQSKLRQVCSVAQEAVIKGCSDPSLVPPSSSPGVVTPTVVDLSPSPEDSVQNPAINPVTDLLPNDGSLLPEDCINNLTQADINNDGFINETEYGQFLRFYGNCTLDSLSDQQKSTFLLFSGSESNHPDPKFPFSRAYFLSPADAAFLSSVCSQEGLCTSYQSQPPVQVSIPVECANSLLEADTNLDGLLNETEFQNFAALYLDCPYNRTIASRFVFTLLAETTVSGSYVNISGANNPDENLLGEQGTRLHSVCSATSNVRCESSESNDASVTKPTDMCSTNLLFADADYDGMLAEDEYLNFVRSQMTDCDDVPFLSLAQRVVFQFLSCLCITESSSSGNWDCCDPARARIRIDGASLPAENRTNEQTSTITYICTSTASALSQCSKGETGNQILPSFATTAEEKVADENFTGSWLLLSLMFVLAIIYVRANYVKMVF